MTISHDRPPISGPVEPPPTRPTSLPGRLHDLIRRRPLATFFVLANLLSWLAWTPYILSQNGLGLWDYRFPEVLGSSQLSGVLPGAYLGPIFSAFLVTALADGRPGLRHWVGRLLRWKVSWKWYAVALLGVPAVLLVTGTVFSGGQVGTPSLMLLAAYVPALALQMVTTGLAEEPGWRDFALPRLQRRLGALGAAMVLGPLWSLWHMPLFLSDWGGWPDAHWSEPVLFIVFCISFNVVMSYVFNRTGQSLPLAMLLHVSVNNFTSVLWSDLFPTLSPARTTLAQATAAVLVAAVLLITTRGRLGYVPEDQ
ncbi:CPBP family intramembrane glutamic endopeptidase [Auraticoccus monumenti]|uniref:CAAX protease self-immunity n=1 Tax=Auraticoccus monumenti TaxID=675864 RepID=A0A1G6Z2W3_9ACTN|nr:CPBP family intramembrane glutamic endopeptidase [Auraticoccus monumenti]SDD96633.1 CAAX protease self-immunity [Auraticoccus monumenti]